MQDDAHLAEKKSTLYVQHDTQGGRAGGVEGGGGGGAFMG